MKSLTDLTFEEMQHHINEKTPDLEQFLIEVARKAGAKEVVLFDGRTVTL